MSANPKLESAYGRVKEWESSMLMTQDRALERLNDKVNEYWTSEQEAL
jgi:hypothetical protein